MRKQIFHIVLPLLLGLFALGLIVFLPGKAHAANPATISFQGKLVNSDGTNVADGTYSIVFRIYNTSSPTMTTACTSTASCLWEETQSSVSVTNGVFQVELGSACALTSSSCNNSAGGPINYASTSSLYLTMQFNGDTSGTRGGFMYPLIHMNSVPFALYSDNAGALSGLSASNFVQLAQGIQTDSSTTNGSIAINKTGASGDIMLLQANSKNALEVNNSGTVLLGQAGASGLNGTLTFNNGTGSNTVSLALQADPGSSYTLLLPTTGPSTSQCLQTDSNTANQLKFASCASGGGSTLYASYNLGTATSDQTILLDNSKGGGIVIKDNASTVGNAFQVQNSSGTSLLNADSSNMRLGVNVTYTAMSTPTGLTVAAAGSGTGTLAGTVGTTQYYYKVSAIDSAGGETAASTESTPVTLTSTKIMNLYWAAVTGASGYKIYRSTTTGSEVYLTTVLSNYSSTSPYQDTGAITAGTASAPSANSAYTSAGNSSSTLQLAVGGSGTPTGQVYVGGISPKLSSTVANACAGTPAGVFVQGRYAYIAGSSGGSVGYLCIYDVTNPASPLLVSRYNFGTMIAPSNIVVQGKYAYMADYYGVDIIDVSNPASPKYIRSSGCSIANSVYVQGMYYFCVGGSVTNQIQSYTLSGAYVGSNSDSNLSGLDTIFIQDQYAYITNPGANKLDIYDISNPSSPTFVAANSDSNLSNPQSVYVQGRYAYVASKSNNKLAVYDISNPAAPTFVGVNSDSNLSGPQSVYVYGRYAYIVSNTDNSLSIYDTGGTYSQQLEAGGAEFGTLAVNSNLQAAADASIYGGLTVGQSAQIFGNLGASGLVTLQPSSALSAGQTAMTQTFTNSSSTGGTVNGYNQTITVNNTSSTSTTNGINISLADATSLANVDRGIYVDLSGVSNSSAIKEAARFNAGSVIQTTNGPVYLSGADASGSANTGTGAVSLNTVFTSGGYAYTVNQGSSTVCSQAAGSAIGCELQIYDVSNPSSPKYIGGADASGLTNSGTGNSTFEAIYVAGHYAYIANNSNTSLCQQAAGSAIGCELQIYDVSNPSSPKYIGGADASGLTNSGTAGLSDTDIFVSGKYVYETFNNSGSTCSQTAGSATGCELKIFDISNPASPTYVGGADASGSTNSGSGVSNFRSVYISGKYAYIANGGAAGTCSQTPGSAITCNLQVYDVSNASTPTYVGGANQNGSTNSGSSTLGQARAVVVNGQYAFVGIDDISSSCSGTAGGANGCEFQVYNIYNPASPTYVGGADASGSTNSGSGHSSVLSIIVAGKYAYAEESGDGTSCSQTAGSATGCELKIFDISNPASPTYVGGADASGLTNSGTGLSTFTGMSINGRYLYTANGGSATSCSQTAGLAIGCEFKVWDITGLEATTLSAGSIQGGTLQIQNAGIFNDQLTVNGSATIGQSLNVGNGFNVQSSSGNSIFNVDSSGTAITMGDSTNGLVFTPTTFEPVLNGTARHSKTINLTPEFPGAVMTGDGSNNTGTMTSDFCGNDGAGTFVDINTSICNNSGDFHNYYSWTSTGANDYEIFVRWKVPSDYSAMAASNPISWYSKKSATGDDVKMTIYTSTGAACGSATSMTNTASTWLSTNYGIGVCTPSAGDVLTFDIHVAVATSGDSVQMGEVSVSYLSKW